jgi:GT2 family glycosyltransferase
MTMSKTISVIILTRNRPQVLLNTLQKLQPMVDGSTEVIVVDNASENPVEGDVRSFPVHIVRTARNMGVAGWNAGMKVATGKYFLLLDDDAYPNNAVFEGIRRRFEADRTIGALALHISHPATGVSENNLRFERLLKKDDRDFLFIGCGVALRREVFETIGGFADPLFIYWHEMEYGVRLLAAGYSIQIAPELTVYHLQSQQGRLSQSRLFYEVRNMLWIARKYFRSFSARKLFLRHIGHFGKLALQQNLIVPFLRGVVRGLGRNEIGARALIPPEIEAFIIERWILTSS